MTKIFPLQIDSEMEFEGQLLSQRRKKTRTGHSTIYAELAKMPEMRNIIVTERELGAMRRKMERQYKRILSESELKAIIRVEKTKRLFG